MTLSRFIWSIACRCAALSAKLAERLRKYCKNLTTAGHTEISVYQLMSGRLDEEWAGRPDQPWVLVGTQGQLLSRALNRGYSMSRFEWPVHFGLLNQDCRWIIDEVQLMGSGLWTTAQLDWMRQKRFKSIKPCPTTWMSATLAASFLATTDRKADKCDKTSDPNLSFDDPALDARRNAIRPIQWANTDDCKAIAELVSRQHMKGTLSLVVCNTVETAGEIFLALPRTTPKILLTSRFRRQDRDVNETTLLEFEDKRRERAGAIPTEARTRQRRCGGGPQTQARTHAASARCPQFVLHRTRCVWRLHRRQRLRAFD